MDAVISVTPGNYHEKCNKEGKAALVFVGDPEKETGVSWCPDCAKADAPLKEKIIPALQQHGYTVYYCLAGDYDTFKNENSATRVNAWIKITSVPTLLLVEDYKEVKRFEEEALFTDEQTLNFLKQ